ncbi:MAG: nucleoside 2-deoxyribosyltransferase [Sandaracinaceae bacterium]|nr:nucleoside 2-deoxyribosyltransferase [Sandaracinaceae bacterium]
MSHHVFVSSRISTARHRALNLRIGAACEALGLRPFLPQVELDDEVLTAIDILHGNERAVASASLVIVVFDAAAAGVAMELAQARALDKPILGYRTGRSEARERLGMMLQGAWEALPDARRVRTLRELDVALARLRDDLTR